MKIATSSTMVSANSCTTSCRRSRNGSRQSDLKAGGSNVLWQRGRPREHFDEDKACCAWHLFLPCFGTDCVCGCRTEQRWLSCRRAARIRKEARGCTSQAEK